MIKLMSIEIDGFITPSQYVKLDFADSNIICIYGDNGSGKTTFLEILYAVFSRDEGKLERFAVKSIDLTFIVEESSQEKIQLINNSIDLKIKNCKDKIVLSKKELYRLYKEKNEKENKKLEYLRKIKEIEEFKDAEISKQLRENSILQELFINVKKLEKQKEKIKVDYKMQLISKDDLNNQLKEIDNQIENIKSKSKSKEEEVLKEINRSKEIQKYNRDIKIEKGEVNLLEDAIAKINQNILELENFILANREEVKNYKKQKYVMANDLNSTQSILISKKKSIEEDNSDKYYWDDYDVSILSVISSIFLGTGRGIKENKTFPRTKLWAFFNINKELIDGRRLSGKDIDNFTDKLVDYLSEDKDDRTKERFFIESKEKEKNIDFENIEINELEELLVKKYKDSIIESDKKITKALSNITMNLFSKDFSNEIDFEIEKLKDKLLKNRDLILKVFDYNSNYNDIFKNKVIDILNDLDNLRYIDSLNKNILFKIVETLENENKLFKRIQTFENRYNKFLCCDKKIVFSYDKINIDTSNGIHSLEKLSSGERHMLTFLATILLLGDIKDFILIDEPEISLNVDWQRKILSVIAKLAPNSQIIIATHSPLVVEDYINSLVEIGLNDKG